MKCLKKVLALVLALVMTTTLLSVPAMADTIATGTNGHTVYLSMQVSSSDAGDDTISEVKEGDYFYVLVNFSNNPVDNSVLDFSACVNFDQTKMVATYAESPLYDVTGVYNEEFNANTVYFNGAAPSGLKLTRKGDVLASGTLQWIEFEALTDLTANDLASIKVVSSAVGVNGEGRTEFSDKDSKKFTIIQVPGISASVKTGAEFFNSDSVADVKSDIKVEYVDAAGVATDVTADATVTLPSGGLKVGANTVTVSYNGYTAEVEVTAGADAITGLSVSGGKLSYAAGEKLDMSDLVVTATYASGKDGVVGAANYSFEIDGSAVASDVVLTKGAHDGKTLTVVSGTLEETVGTLSVSAGAVKNFEVTGVGTVAVPLAGSADNTLTLAVDADTVVDAYGDKTTAKNVTFKLDNELTGVSVNETTGVVTVTKAAIENAFTSNQVTANVKVIADGAEKLAAITITREESEARSVTIMSDGAAVADAITVGIPSEKAFSAQVLDQYGSPMSAETTMTLTLGDGVGAEDITFVSGKLNVANKSELDGKKVTLTAKAGTLSDSVVIEAKTVSVDWTGVAAANITYGQTKADAITLPSGTGAATGYINGVATAMDGTFEVVEATAVPAAGSVDVTVKFTITSEGTYEGTEFTNTYNVAVAQKALTLADGTVAITKEYDTTTAAGALTGALALTGIVGSDDVSVNMSGVTVSAYPSANYGTHTVTLSGIALTGAAAANYTVASTYDFAGATITKTVLKVSDFTVAAATEATYDGTAKAVTVTANVTGAGAITVLYNGETSAVNAGEYAITINVAEGDNYAAATGLDLGAKLTIAKADIALTVDPATIVLVGDETATIAPSATLANAADTATYTFTSADAAVAVTEAGTVSATGNAKTTVTVTANAGANYNPASKEVTVTAVAQPVESITVDKAFNVTYTIEGNVISVSGQAVNLDKVAISEIKVADLSSKGIVIFATPAADNKSVSVTVDGKSYNYDVVLNIQKVDAIINAADAADTEVPGVAASLTDETMKAISDAAVAAGVEEVDVTVTAKVEVKDDKATVSATYTVTDKDGNDLTPADNTIEGTKTPVSVEVPVDTDASKVMVKNAAGEYEVEAVTDGKITIEVSDFTASLEIVEPATITIKYTYNKVKEDGSTPETVEYDIDDLGAKLPTDEKSGYNFKGWQIGEKVYTTLTADLLDTEDDTTYEATASFKKKSSSSGGIGYVISVESSKNGSVKSSDKTAGKGDTVTLTVKPDKGYELDELIVTDKNGDELKLKSKGDGKYTFTMPKSKVYVEATFVAVEAEVEASFSDVAETDSYFNAVEWAVAEGITTGYANGTFLPNNTVTRAQAVTFLWRAMGEPKPETTEMPFVDVPVGSYYYDAVLWAVENGITTGMTATTFVPDKTVSRAQTITFLWRTAKMEGYDVSVGAETNILSYADAMTIGEYAIPAMQWACGEEIMSSYADGTLRPNDGCTRAQTVTFLYRFLG